jgi:NifU-like protein involved in Fe-S cluster formation
MAMDFARYKKMNDEKENFREMEGATVDHVYRNDACGDGYHIFLKVSPQGLIEDASYTTTGCGFGLAALAVVTRLVRGKTLDQAQGLEPSDIEADFEFPERRRNYPVTAVEAMRQTLSLARQKVAAGA